MGGGYRLFVRELNKCRLAILPVLDTKSREGRVVSVHVLISIWTMDSALEERKMSLSDKDDVAHIEKATEATLSSDEVIEDPVLEARLNRKFDVHILPWLFGIW